MPPIPTLDPEAVSLIDSIERHHNDLSTLQIPRLRACTSPLTAQQACAAEVREDIEGLARQIEELDVLVDDHRTEPARRELRRRVQSFRDLLINLRKNSRAAVLASKHAIDSKSRSQRAELLRSPQKSTSSSSGKITEDVMKANHDVTEALQRTIGLMQKELERCVMSSQLLGKFLVSHPPQLSNPYPRRTTHDKFDYILGTSKQLITALEKTDWVDRVLIISGLVFFGLGSSLSPSSASLTGGYVLPGLGSSTRGVVQKTGEAVTTVSAATTGLNANHVVEDVSSGI